MGEFKHWLLCRIDGSTGPLERRPEMDRFRHGGDKLCAPRLFLPRRAGGLGIYLTAVDTVVLYVHCIEMYNTETMDHAEPTNRSAGARSGTPYR